MTTRYHALHALLTACPGLTTDQCAMRLGMTVLSARKALGDMRRLGRVRSSYAKHHGRQWAVWYAVADMAPAPGRAPLQDLMLAVVDDTLRSTAELANAAGITRRQAKNALAYLARKGRVMRVRYTRDCSWARPGAAPIPVYEPEDEWTPKPWIHPIRARALGLPSPLQSSAA